MLCPNCGTEVGDRPTLCPSCAAKSASSSGSGAAIGAIRPNVKIVRLKPGEQYPGLSPQEPVQEPPSSAEFSQAQAPQDSTTSFQSRPDQTPQFESQSSARRNEVRQAAPQPPSQMSFPRYAGFFLIIAALWALVVLFRASNDSSPAYSPVNQPKEDFSHIVIHEKKQVNVDGRNVVGMIQLEDQQIALGKVEATWSAGKNSLTLDYYVAPDQSEVQLKTNEPVLKVSLQFGAVKGQLDRERLQSYVIEYLGGEKPIRIVKSFSVHLAAFGEVSPLSGSLKKGEKVRGTMRDSRSDERDGKVIQINWELTFDSPLNVVP